jgi:hypothetical protein
LPSLPWRLLRLGPVTRGFFFTESDVYRAANKAVLKRWVSKRVVYVASKERFIWDQPGLPLPFRVPLCFDRVRVVFSTEAAPYCNQKTPQTLGGHRVEHMATLKFIGVPYGLPFCCPLGISMGAGWFFPTQPAILGLGAATTPPNVRWPLYRPRATPEGFPSGSYMSHTYPFCVN